MISVATTPITAPRAIFPIVRVCGESPARLIMMKSILFVRVTLGLEPNVGEIDEEPVIEVIFDSLGSDVRDGELPDD